MNLWLSFYTILDKYIYIVKPKSISSLLTNKKIVFGTHYYSFLKKLHYLFSDANTKLIFSLKINGFFKIILKDFLL